MTASIINKTIKSIVAASAALIMAASVAACGPNAATPSEENNASNGGATTSKVTARSLDEIKKSGVLKVAVFSDKAPFGYIDKDGKNAGYDIVFAERLAKDLGVKVKYTSVDPAARVDVLTSNKVDITLANFTVTDERKEKVDFAKPYMKVALGVVSPENAEITDVSQLKGKTLIIAKGTTAEAISRRTNPTSSCRSTTSTPTPTTRCSTAVATPSPPTTPRCWPGPRPTRASRWASPSSVTKTPSRRPCRRATRSCSTGSTTRS